MNISPGAQANVNGADLESVVKTILTELNVDFIAQAPYQNIYGSKRARIDFLVDDVAIECKFQKVAGSVSEKMPYVVYNLSEFPRGLLVLDGAYFRKHEGIQKWLTKAASVNKKFDWCWVEDLGSWLENNL